MNNMTNIFSIFCDYCNRNHSRPRNARRVTIIAVTGEEAMRAKVTEIYARGYNVLYVYNGIGKRVSF